MGETNWPLMTAKSAHGEQAQCFDAMLYDGTNIVRYNKIFYEYSGKSWSVISDDVIKAKIQRMLAKFKPSDTLVRGVLNSLATRNVSRVENGGYPIASQLTTLYFNNGLVDLSEIRLSWLTIR